MINKRAEKMLARHAAAMEKGSDNMWAYPIVFSVLDILEQKDTITEDELLEKLASGQEKQGNDILARAYAEASRKVLKSACKREEVTDKE